jgi:predicted RNA binding protein YcfA (HicA-like mRNA interferase family)
VTGDIMSKIEKLIVKLLSRPKTFKYSDMRTILTSKGYVEDNKGKTTGSRVMYVHEKHPLIILHKPHPGDELKKYMIDMLAEIYESEGLEDE